MRYVMYRVGVILAIAFFVSGTSLAQSNLHVNESEIHVLILDDGVIVNLTIDNPGRGAGSAIVSLELIDPRGEVQSHKEQEISLRAGQTKVRLKMPPVFAQTIPADRKNLVWYRLRYSVTISGPSDAKQDPIHGVVSISETAQDLFELHIAAPMMVMAGQKAELRVRAVHPGTMRPVEGVTVQGAIDLDADDGEPLMTSTAKTDHLGFAALRFALPSDINADSAEQLDVKVTGKLDSFSGEANGELYLNIFPSISLSTDKPLYQPGQMLHSRMLAFDPDHKAIAGQTVRFEISDPDGGLVFLATSQTSSYGVATADWQIPDNLRLGDYAIRATIGENTARAPNGRATVKISRYDLPSFSVGVKPDRAYYLPGQNADIEVHADYLFGEKVRHGHIRVVQEDERSWNYREQKWDIKESASVEGETDDLGRYTARMDLSTEHNRLDGSDYDRFRDTKFAAYFTDTSTGRTEQRRFDLRITKDPIHVYVVGVGRYQPKGLPLEFYVSTDYADGAPAPCDLDIRWSPTDSQGRTIAGILQQPLRRVRTNRYGVAKVSGLNLPAAAAEGQFELTFLARDKKGLLGTYSESEWQVDRPGVRVETDKTLYTMNEPIAVNLSASVQNMVVVVDAVHDNQVLASRLVPVRHGHAEVVFPANEKFQNKVSILAYGLGMLSSEQNNGVAGSHSVYFPRNRMLNLDIHLSKFTYRPGDEASADIRVTSPDGDQKASALGLVVVDKAIEERTRTDMDFAGDSTFLGSLQDWTENDELNGVRIRDLDKLDLNKQLPDGFEVTAEALLQLSGGYPNMFESDSMDEGLRKMFAESLDTPIRPIAGIL